MDFSNNIDGWNETTYSATTVAASNSITLNPTFTVPSGSAFSAVITSATGYLQTVDYRYNIRGQLLNINNSKLSYDGGVKSSDNNDLFGMQFLYDNVDTNLGNTAYFNGKLSAVKWMSKDANGNSSYERAFNYYYDALNRDTAAIYNERTTASTGAFTTTHGWDENRITYDQNGNLQTLFRMEATQGAGNHIPIDNLTYTYSTSNPNQLQSVADATGNVAGFIPGTGNYTYDGNGNLTADPYKGLTLGYDVLNRTDKITVTTGSGQYINYIYDASGNLIRKQAFNSGTLQTTTDYIDGFVYLNTALSYFPMPEGRVLFNGTTYTQEFIITDQQGNARLSFQNNGSGTAVVKQENSYYGFGLVMLNSPVSTPATPNKQLYNGGSEWQNDYSNLPDYYQTFNRNYDAALGRFVGVDPAAEGAESMSSYQYSGNNPVMYNDPLGDLKTTNNYPLVMNNEFNNDQEEYREKQFENTFGNGFGGIPLAAGGDFMGILGDPGPINIYNVGNAATGTRANGTLTDAVNAINRFTGSSLANCGTCGISYYLNLDGTISASPNGRSTNDYNNTVDNFDRVTHHISFVNDISPVEWANLTGANQGGQQPPADNNSFGTHLIGPGLIGLGQPINALKPIGMLGSKPGSSIASYTLRKMVPGTLKGTFGEEVGGTLAEIASTNGLGAALGRAVPWVGWIWTYTDVTWTIFNKTLDSAPNAQARQDLLNGYNFSL